MKRIQISIVIAMFAGLMAGCERYDQPEVGAESPSATNAQPTTPQKVGAEYQEALKETGKLADQTKDQFVAAMNAKLQELDQQVDQLASRAETLKDDARKKADEALAALKEQREKVTQQFNDLKAASKDAWADTKQGFTAALAELEKAFQAAQKNFTE